MRRFLRFAFTFIMSVLTFVPLQFLFSKSNTKIPSLYVFLLGLFLSIIMCFWISKKVNKDEPVLFWIMFVILLVWLVICPIVVGYGSHFFSRMGLQYIKDVTMGAILMFWYMVSILLIRLSKDEIQRQKETLSERELRRANERRDPALDVAERERLNKMLASMPEKERQELLKKQAEYEAKHNKN